MPELHGQQKAEALFCVAECHFKEKNYKKAVDHLEEAVKMPEFQGESRAKTLLLLGKSLFKFDKDNGSTSVMWRPNMTKAIEHLDAALKMPELQIESKILCFEVLACIQEFYGKNFTNRALQFYSEREYEKSYKQRPIKALKLERRIGLDQNNGEIFHYKNVMHPEIWTSD